MTSSLRQIHWVWVNVSYLSYGDIFVPLSKHWQRQWFLKTFRHVYKLELNILADFLMNLYSRFRNVCLIFTNLLNNRYFVQWNKPTGSLTLVTYLDFKVHIYHDNIFFLIIYKIFTYSYKIFLVPLITLTKHNVCHLSKFLILKFSVTKWNNRTCYKICYVEYNDFVQIKINNKISDWNR